MLSSKMSALAGIAAAAMALASCHSAALQKGGAAGMSGHGGASGDGGDAGHDDAPDRGEAGAGGSSGVAGSPGTVTLRLSLPAATYCDNHCGSPPHIRIFTSDGQEVQPGEPYCSVLCDSCKTALCPPITCPAGGGYVDGAELPWDGRVYERATCGASGTACYRPTFLPPGKYVARLCATPGTVSASTDGYPTFCTPSGVQQCIEVPFDFPTAGVVAGSLPTGGEACHAIRAADYDQTCATEADCILVTERKFCTPDACTNCENAAINVKDKVRYQVDTTKNTPTANDCPCPSPPIAVCNGGKCDVFAAPLP
jgi:hypothetical protein